MSDNNIIICGVQPQQDNGLYKQVYRRRPYAGHRIDIDCRPRHQIYRQKRAFRLQTSYIITTNKWKSLISNHSNQSYIHKT